MNGTWKLRHAGSPQTVDGLTDTQVAEGLQERAWDPLDEVMGPGDADWQTLEDHPHFAEVVEDLEPPPKFREDEARLDMNPLIDVALVLLIFFIITATYETMRKVIDAPDVDPQTPVMKVKAGEIALVTIRVTAKMDGDRVVIRVEDEVVPEDELKPALEKWVRRTGKAEMLYDVDGQVPHRVKIAILDAAKGAGVRQALERIHKGQLSGGGESPG